MAVTTVVPKAQFILPQGSRGLGLDSIHKLQPAWASLPFCAQS